MEKPIHLQDLETGSTLVSFRNYADAGLFLESCQRMDDEVGGLAIAGGNPVGILDDTQYADAEDFAACVGTFKSDILEKGPYSAVLDAYLADVVEVAPKRRRPGRKPQLKRLPPVKAQTEREQELNDVEDDRLRAIVREEIVATLGWVVAEIEARDNE